MMKLLLNICRKAENLWVKWIHEYYMKNQNVMTGDIKKDSSWILKNVLSQRDKIENVQDVWDKMLTQKKFSMKTVYKEMLKGEDEVT